MTRSQRKQFVVACIVEAFGFTMREEGESEQVRAMGGRVESAGIHMRESLPKPDRVASEHILAMHNIIGCCAKEAGEMTFAQYSSAVMAIVAEYAESLPSQLVQLRADWKEVEGLIWESYQLFDKRCNNVLAMEFGDVFRRDIMRAMI